MLAPAECSSPLSVGLFPFLSDVRQPPRSALFPYTTLFRSAMSACDVQAGRFGSVGQCATTTGASATVKLELQPLDQPPELHTYTKLILAPAQCSSPLSVGMVPMLSVGLQPPLFVNPAFQVA